MKKHIIILMIATAGLLSPALAENKNSASVNSLERVYAKKERLSKSEMKMLVNRLHEIHAAAKANPGIDEKKQLRKEVKIINDQLNKQSGVYVYLSGAAILIILLLIILL